MSFVRILFGAVLLLCGCSRNRVEESKASEPVLSHQYREGSVMVILSASDTNITTSGKIRLMVDVHAPPGDDVRVPEAGDSMALFSPGNSYSEPVQTLANGKNLHRRVWILVPSLPGETALLPQEITVGPITVVTEPVPLSVTSLLPDRPETYEIKDIALPAKRLPEEEKRRHMLFLFLGAGIVTGLLTAAVYMRKRTRQAAIPLPHEVAREALDQLPEDGLERICSLTAILLNFIERRFQIVTPAQTLQEMRPQLLGKIPQQQGVQLEAMLSASETFRFSHRVPPAFADELETFVRQFIDDTKEEPCD